MRRSYRRALTLYKKVVDYKSLRERAGRRKECAESNVAVVAWCEKRKCRNWARRPLQTLIKRTKWRTGVVMTKAWVIGVKERKQQR